MDADSRIDQPDGWLADWRIDSMIGRAAGWRRHALRPAASTVVAITNSVQFDA